MKRKILPYNPKLKDFASHNRRNMPIPEAKLWQCLKSGQIRGFDFDRQRPILDYIVDFYCKDLMLAIEIDGDSHEGEEAESRDALREFRLEKLGITVLRFANQEVMNSIQLVVKDIEDWISENEHDLKGRI